ncbi:hypothetical protein AB9P05_21385 [Roseivirga sp. BDSF3-8]|uniref:hypothetical protein n=1 Tax=Roseivirga sp. BDSF3-8 TaxID=3241598 RepID=UPI0035325075
MAVIENNPWIEGARGMVRGAIVYRQRAGRTIVSARPAKSSKPRSEKQKAHHKRFGEATAYSKRVKENDALFAMYRAAAEGFISWQNLAVRDYMYAPEVEKVVAEGFTGKTGEVLEVYASDDFGICCLRVTVMDGRGTVVESGECHVLIANKVYAYALGTDLDMTNGVWVRAEAADAAGNVTVYEELIYAGDNEGESVSTASMYKAGGGRERRAYVLPSLGADGACDRVTKTVRQRQGRRCQEETTKTTFRGSDRGCVGPGDYVRPGRAPELWPDGTRRDESRLYKIAALWNAAQRIAALRIAALRNAAQPYRSPTGSKLRHAYFTKNRFIPNL